MNKLEEYRDLNAKELSEEVSDPLMQKAKFHAYEEGFDAAIALDLPVKFHKWTTEGHSSYMQYVRENIKNYPDGIIPIEDKYKYWEENIFKP